MMAENGDVILKMSGSVRVHAVFNKKMGAKEYRMASIDLLDDDGNVVDVATVFCGADMPKSLHLQVFKGQLGVRVE